MIDDKFSERTVATSDPAYSARSLTPNDILDLNIVSRALYVGGAGDLSGEMLGGQSVVFAGLTAGTIIPIRVRKVKASGTTATEIVALW